MMVDYHLQQQLQQQLTRVYASPCGDHDDVVVSRRRC